MEENHNLFGYVLITFDSKWCEMPGFGGLFKSVDLRGSKSGIKVHQ